MEPTTKSFQVERSNHGAMLAGKELIWFYQHLFKRLHATKFTIPVIEMGSGC